MVDPQLQNIFRSGSKTYFYSSVFFPPAVRQDVYALYGFVRVADNFVDTIPQQSIEFHDFCRKARKSFLGEHQNDVVLDSFAELATRKRFEASWIDAFLEAMEMDLTVKSYKTIEEVERYMFGSAEVVGLMMGRILELPEESKSSSQMLGRAMQYINFIRDIAEDNQLGRLYFPLDELSKFGLTSLHENDARAQPEQFRDFVRAQVERYQHWQSLGEAGFHYIPRRYRIPIKTASEMYKWTSHQLWNDPMLVYRRKVKPSIAKIVCRAAYETVSC